MPAYLSPQDLATRYNVSVSTVYTWAREGGLPYARMGRLIRFSAADVAEWERANTVTNAQERPSA